MQPAFSLQTFRSLQGFGRLVLAWFVLAMGAAVASPMVNPQAMELVCSGTGVVKLLVQTEAGLQELSSHTLDCPLCAHVGAPPPTPFCAHPETRPQAQTQRPLSTSHIATRTAAPMPPRGPPDGS